MLTHGNYEESVPLSSLSTNKKLAICAEIQLKQGCAVNSFAVRSAAYVWLMSSGFTVTLGRHDVSKVPNELLRNACSDIIIEFACPSDNISQNSQAFSHVKDVIIPINPSNSALDPNPIVLASFQFALKVCVFQLNEDEVEEEIEDTLDDVSPGEQLPVCRQWILPHSEFHGLWDALHFDVNIKTDLLEYASTAMLFSKKKVNNKFISWNRLILLHGPPGTGKTSLCKALAHKLSIRLSNEYESGQLLEINTHSLFSKWFSESGKLVLKLFSKIKELLEEPNSFVCVLIDEVESLSAARKLALAGNEPSDSIRVVNALLTQIDGLKKYHNALVIATSNITEALDLAFLDRADLIMKIPAPNENCRYEIFRDSAKELMRIKLIAPHITIPSYTDVVQRSNNKISNEKLTKNSNNETFSTSIEYESSNNLLALAKACQGFSGRALKKLPFQAFTYFCNRALIGYKSNFSENEENECNTTILEFIDAMAQAAKKEIMCRATNFGNAEIDTS